MASNTYEAKLVEKLASMFGESLEVSRLIFEVLRTGKSIIGFSEILALARRLMKAGNVEDFTREAVLSMYGWRILIPLERRREASLSWERKVCTFRKDEAYIIPQCITYAFEKFQAEGACNCKYAAEKYFDRIGEPYRFKVPEIVDEMVDKAYFKLFTNGARIREICLRKGLPGDRVGVLIVELKGGGFISPALIPNRPVNSAEEEMFRGSPIYELNRALFVLRLKWGNKPKR